MGGSFCFLFLPVYTILYMSSLFFVQSRLLKKVGLRETHKLPEKPQESNDQRWKVDFWRFSANVTVGIYDNMPHTGVVAARYPFQIGLREAKRNTEIPFSGSPFHMLIALVHTWHPETAESISHVGLSYFKRYPFKCWF